MTTTLDDNAAVGISICHIEEVLNARISLVYVLNIMVLYV